MPKAKKLHKSLSNLNARLAAKPKQSESTRKQPAPSQSSAKRNKKASARPIIPFAPTDRILLVGEGNFSFTRAILQHPTLEHIPPSNITATAYDSEEICNQKYPDAADIVASLRSQGVKILFGVDATNLNRCSQLKNTRWDRIVWNFPHVGENILYIFPSMSKCMLFFQAKASPIEIGIFSPTKSCSWPS
jgi:25S rRNA (uracil2634-N3)-methyltransferase